MPKEPLEKCFAIAAVFMALWICVSLGAGQDAATNEWLPPDPPEALHVQLCHKDFIRCWRIRGGDWHIYHDEDKAFLSQNRGVIQWFALEGKLPK